MWGNLQGWMISAALLVALIYFMTVAKASGDLSEPTAWGRDASNTAPLVLPFKLKDVVADADEGRDGAAEYRALVDQFTKRPNAYTTFAETPREVTIASLEALPKLLDARTAGKSTVLIDDLDRVMKFETDIAPLTAFKNVGHAAIVAGLLVRDRDDALARQYAESAFSLGYKLFQERLTPAELQTALTLMSESLAALRSAAEKANDSAATTRYGTYAGDLADLTKNRITPARTILGTVDARLLGAQRGDLFLVAQDPAADKVFRVESIFALGRMRFFTGNPPRLGDQVGALRVLKKLASDGDPVVRAAAKASLELTEIEYRQLGR